MSTRKLGVYICYCGGNISDYVDCEQVRVAIENEDGVDVAKTTMFTCSDATQQEIIEDIQTRELDGIVVASCSPTLHQMTFRGVAERAGLNPYTYVQVNLREQCSWAHTDLPELATEKAIQMVKAGIARTRHTESFEKTRIDTVPRALVVGAGVAGLRSALALSDLGISVFIAEKEDSVGGWVARFGKMFPNETDGAELITRLTNEISQRENITIYSSTELLEKTGSLGDFEVTLRVRDDLVSLNVGAIIITTGFDTFEPADGHYGYGHPGVLTLPQFKELIDHSDGPLEHEGREIRSVAYVYCVGSRTEDPEQGHPYCSRFCCNAAIHTSLLARERSPGIHQYHLTRDVRTYGKFETIYQQARQDGTVFIRFDEHSPPSVEADGHGLKITVKDILTQGKELAVEADLVVLVTAMEPRKNESLNSVLKLPVGLDGFYNEIHPKLRPVETVIDGVFIAGAAQAPRTSAETVASALAATAKAAALLKKGHVELSPLIAVVDAEACTWCDECVAVCPYAAISKIPLGDKEIALVSEATCKGCGACIPVCPKGALELRGSTDIQIREMIEAMGVIHA